MIKILLVLLFNLLFVLCFTVYPIQLTRSRMRSTQSRISEHSPKIEKLISVQESQVEQHIKARVQQRLMEDAEFLLDKKRKQAEKRQKVRRVQEQIQKRREKKLKAISQKSNHSALVMEKNKEIHNKKIKQQQEYFNQVQNKIEKKERDSIRQALIRQRELEKQMSKSSSKLMKQGGLNQTFDSSYQPNRLINNSQYEQLSFELQAKTQKAEANNEKHKKNIIDRMRQKSEAITSIQEKALNLSMDEDANKLKNWSHKVENIEAAQSHIKSGREKALIERRKSIKYKIDKWSENMRHLSNREEQRYEQLQNKFDRKFQPKEWKDQRLEKYWKLWEGNSRRLQQQKNIQADRILEKHAQITEQNRLYKSKKDMLLQEIKLI